jgi:hypothetical protein
MHFVRGQLSVVRCSLRGRPRRAWNDEAFK